MWFENLIFRNLNDILDKSFTLNSLCETVFSFLTVRSGRHLAAQPSRRWSSWRSGVSKSEEALGVLASLFYDAPFSVPTRVWVQLASPSWRPSHRPAGDSGVSTS